MINPIYQSKCDKYFTDPEVLENIPNMFLLLGGVFGALGIIATILISEPNQSKEDQDEMSSIQDKTSTDQMTQTFSLTPMQVLRTRTFYQVIFKCRLQYSSSSALKQNQSFNKKERFGSNLLNKLLSASKNKGFFMNLSGGLNLSHCSNIVGFT